MPQGGLPTGHKSPKPPPKQPKPGGRGRGAPEDSFPLPFPFAKKLWRGRGRGKSWLASTGGGERQGDLGPENLSPPFILHCYIATQKSPFFPCANGVLHPLHAVADPSQLPHPTHPVSCFPALTLLEKKGESKGLLLPPPLTPAGIITQKPHAGI